MYTVTLYSTVQQHFSTIYISMYVLIASLQYTYVNYIGIMVLEHVQCYIFPNSVYCTLRASLVQQEFWGYIFLQPSSGHWDARDGCLLHCTSLSAESIRGMGGARNGDVVFELPSVGPSDQQHMPRTHNYWIQKHMWFCSEIRMVQNGCMDVRIFEQWTVIVVLFTFWLLMQRLCYTL